MHEVILVAICVLLMRYGITTAFGFAYFGNSEYFQTDMVSTVFGACNTIARFSTIISPMVAEVLPQPIILITICTFIAAASSLLLIKPANVLGNDDSESQSPHHQQNEDEPDVVRDFYRESNEDEKQKDEDRKTEVNEESFNDNYEGNTNDINNKNLPYYEKKEKFMIMDDDEEEEEDEDQI